ncbi:MAG: class I SAM-dependent methyltransferase [Fuerstiella sp.]|nr:class I SAM-dependent methyltransferase [Fuerstiella sp.]
MKTTVSKWKRAAKSRVRNIAEFGGIRRKPLNQYQDAVRRLYDGPQGAVLHLSSFFSLHEPLMGQLFKSRRFDASRFDRILDVGSGAGQIIRHLLETARPDAEIVGFDLSYEMLKRARERLNSNRPAFVAADMLEMPFRDNTFDCITCGYVLEHIPDPFPGLSEFARVLKPGGTALLLVTENSLSGLVTSHTWKCRTFSRRELREACQNVGLSWHRELWFTRFHEMLKLGGILVEVVKEG